VKRAGLSWENQMIEYFHYGCNSSTPKMNIRRLDGGSKEAIASPLLSCGGNATKVAGRNYHLQPNVIDDAHSLIRRLRWNSFRGAARQSHVRFLSPITELMVDSRKKVKTKTRIGFTLHLHGTEGRATEEHH